MIKIGFLPFCLEKILYESPNNIKEFEKRIKKILLKNLGRFGKVINPGLVLNLEMGKKAGSLFLKEDVDVIIMVYMSYITSDVPLKVIQKLKKPIIVMNSPLRTGFTTKDVMENLAPEHGIVGVVEISNLLKRINCPHYYIISGLMDEDSTYEKLVPYIEAVRTVKL